MTEGEKTILAEIRSVRKHVDDGFRECRDDIGKVHSRIDETDKEVAKAKEIALVNKTKVGTFIAGMVFVFTGIGTLISHWLKSKF